MLPADRPPLTYLEHVSDPESAPGHTWATYLRATRKAKGMSVDELADAAGVHRMTIMRWEANRGGFSHKTLERVALALGVDPGSALALARGDTEAELPPPLPNPLAALVQHYQDMTDADRTDLLERVEWVNEWAAGRLARYPRRARRHDTG